MDVVDEEGTTTPNSLGKGRQDSTIRPAKSP
jgi:hypothetical protein